MSRVKDFQVTINEYMPLRDVVFHTLRRAILMGELEPGERLMELQLTENRYVGAGWHMTGVRFGRRSESWSWKDWW